MPTTGEKPGAGTYICKKCGLSVVLDQSSGTLPLALNAITPNIIPRLNPDSKFCDEKLLQTTWSTRQRDDLVRWNTHLHK